MNKYQRAVQQWNKAAQKWAANKGHALKQRYYWHKMKAAAKRMSEQRIKQ